MDGKLAFYYHGKNPQEFIEVMADFPEIVLFLPRKHIALKEVAEELGRGVIFLEEDEMRRFFMPDYEYHVSFGGSSLETLAAKLKNGFNVVLHFGKTVGQPVSLGRKLREENAAVVAAFELLRLLRGF